MQVLFQVSLMVLKFVETDMLASTDEAEAIAILNDFFSRYVCILVVYNIHHDCIISALVKKLFKKTRCLMRSM